MALRDVFKPTLASLFHKISIPYIIIAMTRLFFAEIRQQTRHMKGSRMPKIINYSRDIEGKIKIYEILLTWDQIHESKHIKYTKKVIVPSLEAPAL